MVTIPRPTDAPSPQSAPLDLNLSNMFDEGMTNMNDTRQGKYRPSNAIITAADPDKLPFHIHLEAGGNLEVRSEARNYSGIKVVVEPDPGDRSRSSKTTSGELPQPVVIHFPRGSEGDYKVTVTHLKHTDSGKHMGSGESSPPQEYTCYIRPCPLCNPMFG